MIYMKYWNGILLMAYDKQTQEPYRCRLTLSICLNDFLIELLWFFFGKFTSCKKPRLVGLINRLGASFDAYVDVTPGVHKRFFIFVAHDYCDGVVFTYHWTQIKRKILNQVNFSCTSNHAVKIDNSNHDDLYLHYH